MLTICTLFSKFNETILVLQNMQSGIIMDTDIVHNN